MQWLPLRFPSFALSTADDGSSPWGHLWAIETNRSPIYSSFSFLLSFHEIDSTGCIAAGYFHVSAARWRSHVLSNLFENSTLHFFISYLSTATFTYRPKMAIFKKIRSSSAQCHMSRVVIDRAFTCRGTLCEAPQGFL